MSVSSFENTLLTVIYLYSGEQYFLRTRIVKIRGDTDEQIQTGTKWCRSTLYKTSETGVAIFSSLLLFLFSDILYKYFAQHSYKIQSSEAACF